MEIIKAILCFLNENEGAIMVAITFAYLVATVFIFIANNKSANATRKQTEELKRQHEETKRLEHMPYMQVDFGKWITSNQRETYLPDMFLNICKTDGDNSSTASSGMSIELTNIGLGHAVNIICRWISGEISEDKKLSFVMLKKDESGKSNIIVSGNRIEETTQYPKTKLIICFEDFLGNHYEQTIEISFEFENNNIRIFQYNVNNPVFIK